MAPGCARYQHGPEIGHGERMKKKPAKRGPKPEILKLEGDWKDNIKKALGVKRPTGGWPKPEPSKKKSD